MKTPQFFLLHLSIFGGLALPASAADLYWKNTAAASWTTANWGTVSGGPYSSEWVSGSDVFFDDNGGTALAITGATTDVASITANENANVTAGGTLTLAGPINVVGGKTINFNTQTLSGTGIKTGTGVLNFNQSNTFTGGFAIRAGTLIARNSGALGAGNVTLGDTSGSDFATLRVSSLTFTRPIILATGTTGALAINNLGAGGKPVYTGGVTGTNNLNIQSVIGGAGDSTTKFETGSINHVGSLTLANTGNGTSTSAIGVIDIVSAIGSNVTDLTISNVTTGTRGLQRVFLRNANNAYTGNTTIDAGAILLLQGNNIIPDGTGKGNVVVNGGGTLDLRGTDTINGLSGSGTVRRGSAGTSILTVGGNNTTASFSGTIENGSGTVGLTKIGSGTLTLDTANTYSGTTSLGNGGGILAISHDSSLGTGTVALTKAGTNSGTLELSNAITVANNFTFSSATSFGNGGSAHIRNASGNNTLAGNLTLTATGGNGINLESAADTLTLSGTIRSNVADNSRTLSLGGEGNGEITGDIVDTGANRLALSKSGTGEWTLSSPGNTYSGATHVLEGTLTLAQPMISDSSNVEIATDAILNLDFVGTEVIGTLTFDGVPQATGTTYGATGSGAAVIDDDRFSGAGKIQVGSIPGSFSSWMASFTFEPGADLTETGDADGDGLSNLLEFALDGDPSSATTSGKVVNKIDGDHFTLTLPVRTGATFTGSGPLSSGPIDAMIYLIEGDDDLFGFTAGVEEQSPALSAGLPALSSGDWEYRTFRLTTPVSGEPKGFLRMGVTSGL